MARKSASSRFALPRRIWLIALGAIVTVGGAGAWLVAYPPNMGIEMDIARYFPLRNLRVEGRFEHVSAEQVRHEVIPFARTGFFGVDLSGVRSALISMPWVRDVRLRRAWPGTLTVHIEEQQVIANWRGKGMVNAQGRLFYPASGVDVAKLPVVDIPAKNGQIEIGGFLELMELTARSGFRVRSFTQDSRGAVIMTLGNGMELRLGHKRQARRLQRFLGFFPSIDDAGRIASVDLRYSNGFAVRRRNGVAHG